MHRGAYPQRRFAQRGLALVFCSAIALVGQSCTQDFDRFDPGDGVGGDGGDGDGTDHCDNDTLDPFFESDVDCGRNCEPCDLGDACTDDDDCESDHCADEVCCESVCNGSGRSCDQPGREGHCVEQDRQ